MLNKNTVTVTKEDLEQLVSQYGYKVIPDEEKMYPPMSFVPFDINGPVPETWIPRYTEQGPNGTRIYKHNKIGKFIMELTESVRIDGALMFRNGEGTYITDYKELFRIAQWLWDEATERQKREVVSYIMDKTPSKKSAPPFIAGFQGEGERDITYVDLIKLEIVEPEKDWFILNIVPHKLPRTPDGRIDMEYRTETCDKLLMGLASNDIFVVRQLEELIGYPLYRSNELRCYFILHGGRGNGKSTLQISIVTLYKGHVVSLSPAELSDRFGKARIVGKMVNFGDDISASYLSPETVSVLKQISAGSYISAEKKYADGFDFKPYVKLIYSCNDLPKFNDKTGALRDRMIIIPMHNYFKEDADTHLAEKMKEEENQMALLIHGLRGVNRILTTQKFTRTEEGEKAMRDFSLLNDPILMWANDFIVESNRQIIDRSKAEVYDEFCSFARENGFSMRSSSEFNDRVSQIFGLKDGRAYITKYINGTPERVFARVWKLDPSKAKTRELVPPTPPAKQSE